MPVRWERRCEARGDCADGHTLPQLLRWAVGAIMIGCKYTWRSHPWLCNRAVAVCAALPV